MNEIEELRKDIQSAKRIVFFGGAGVSTESNIPDFRSNNGIYQQNKYPYPAEVMLSHSFFMSHEKEFFDFYTKEMIYPNAKPNACHRALVKLEEEGKLSSVITQNIDGLHQMAGSKKVIELHGTVQKNHCMKCNHFYTLEEYIEHKGICPLCMGRIKPDVVLYEEPLEEDTVYRAISEIENADLLIIGGTSLVVYPAAYYIRYFKGNKLVIINKGETQYDSKADLVIHDSIGKVMEMVTK